MNYDAGEKDLGLDIDYAKLEDGDDGILSPAKTPPSCGGEGGRCWSLWLWLWVKLLLLLLIAGVLGTVIIKWVGPFLMDKGIIPLMNWERKTFSRTKLAFLIFLSVAIFPSIFLPSSPSMWVAGMTFGYIYGFLLIIGAVAVGVSFPYLIGSFFYHRIQVWLERYPNKASVIRLAGEGSFFNQFRAVAFIRMSPFPYIIYNYCSVATDVSYGPYLLGTFVGMTPEIFVTLYTGIFMETVADASYSEHSLSASQIILDIFVFCIAASATATITLYAKRRLKEMQMEERVLVQ